MSAPDPHIQTTLAIAALGTEIERLEGERIALGNRAAWAEQAMLGAERRIADLERQVAGLYQHTAALQDRVTRQGEAITAILSLLDRARQAAIADTAGVVTRDPTVSRPVPPELKPRVPSNRAGR